MFDLSSVVVAGVSIEDESSSCQDCALLQL
jgi:hypothetical protein